MYTTESDFFYIFQNLLKPDGQLSRIQQSYFWKIKHSVPLILNSLALKSI